MSKEKLIKLQLALFFETIENRPDKLMDKIDDALEGIFDQMPTIIPIPQDAPPEIPSVIMQSKDGKYNCNISRSRIDFMVNYPPSSESSSVQVDVFVEQIRKFVSLIFGMRDINRFGFVGHYFFKHTNPISKIQSKYIKYDLGELEELNIRYNKRFMIGNLMFNDIVDISKGAIQENAKAPQNGIMLMRDLNNVALDTLKIEEVMSTINAKKDNFKLSGIMRLVQ